MGRHALRITILLGLVISLVGGTGIFAVFSDRATTGVNDVTSGSVGRAADLLIATDPTLHDPQSNPSFNCGTFTDDLATGVFSFTANDGSGDDANLCIRNAGSASLDLTTSAIDLVDLDIECTGDEAAFGDTTCGLDQTTGLAQAGELSGSLYLFIIGYDCAGGAPVGQWGGADVTIAGVASTPIALGNLAPGQELCLVFRVGKSAFDPAAEVAQSDRTEWRFAFDGTAT